MRRLARWLIVGGRWGSGGSILVVALGQLDVHAGWIGDVREVEADGGNISKRDIELHAAGLELLAEGFQILDLESDVIDRPAFRAAGGRRGRGEREVHARSVRGGGNRSALARLEREGVDVPIAQLDVVGQE